MIRALQITTLVENTARGSLLGEHGLSFWVDADGYRILFDTGQGRTLAHNTEKLDVMVETADALVASHGHYDHTGGLAAEMSASPKAALYLHPTAPQMKYAQEAEPPHRSIGMPESAKESIRLRADCVVWTDEPTHLAEDVFVTGEIPRRTPFEDVGGPFLLDEECAAPDSLIDDQALCARSSRGLVVILGCAHAGVVNTLDHISQITGERHIHAVLGGMHLCGASDERLAATADAFARYGVQVIAPAHCTGTRAVAFLWSRFPDRCVECTAGSRFVFDAQE